MDTVDADDYNSQWHALWEAGLQPGMHFDRGSASPLLHHLMGSKAVPVAGKRFFVPGCGRGYDVIAAARAGAAAAVGLDLSPVAVADAESHRDETEAPDVARRAAFVAGDFFTYRDPGGLFDVGYDYTFLCALHPAMRKDWAAGWGRHLSVGGELVTLIYPVDPSREAVAGPPWPVTPEIYKDLLTPAGFEVIQLEPVTPTLSHESRVGKEWLGRWRYVGGSSAQ